MQRRVILGGMLAAGLAAGMALVWRRMQARGPALPPTLTPIDQASLDATTRPLPAPTGPLACYHLGHSLVGRDMPAFLAQLGGHAYASQLGWGTPLRAHWEDRVEIMGFDTENAHPAFRPAQAALASGDYDAVILTEMVEIRDAIQWHASAHYLARWAQAARAGKPDVRVYLYETWHRLDDPAGWLERVDADLQRHWVGDLLRGAQAEGAGGPIYLIPAGQALAAVVRAAEAGQVPGLTTRQQLFATNDDGTPDTIHLNDLGHYVVALAHFATLYHRTPVGLPTALTDAKGIAVDFGPTGAALQPLVWQAITAAPYTGLLA